MPLFVKLGSFARNLGRSLDHFALRVDRSTEVKETLGWAVVSNTARFDVMLDASELHCCGNAVLSHDQAVSVTTL